MRFNIILLIFILFSFGGTSLTYLNYSEEKRDIFDYYWAFEKLNPRSPANNTRDLELNTIGDYFLYQNFDHTLSYDLTPKFTSNSSNSQFNKYIKSVIEESFFNSSINLLKGKSYKKNLDNFKNNIAQLRADKKDLHFKYSLRFQPIFEQEINYQRYLSHNTFLDIKQKGKLLDEVMASKLDHNQKLYDNNYIPFDGSYFQYLGGEIQTELKVSQSTKAHLLFRKYLRINYPEKFRLHVEDKDLKSIVIKFKKKKKKVYSFLTVDIVKKLNLRPSNVGISHIILYPGLLVSDHGSLNNKVKTDTGKLIFYGAVNFPEINHPIKFKSTIFKLYYDYKSKRIIPEKSDLLIKFIRQDQLPNKQSNIKKQDIKNFIKDKVMALMGPALLEQEETKALLQEDRK